MQLAKSEYEKGHEFPHLLKLEPVRSAIKILKKIDADLHKLQEEMEGAYELCKGCLQEKYGKKSKKLPQGKILDDHGVCLYPFSFKIEQILDN